MKKPIGNNGIGQNLSLTYYDKIKKLRPYTDITNEDKWEQVIALAVEAMSHTKDLNILIWFLEANIHKDQLEGLKTLQLLYDLLVNYPYCYPEDMEKKSSSLNFLKENILSWLVEEEILPNVYLKNLFSIIKKDLTASFLTDIDKQDQVVLQKHIDKKTSLLKELEEQLKHFDFNQAPLLAPIVTLVRDFLTTLETFYGKIQDHMKHVVKPNPKQDITISQIYEELNRLVLQGIQMDKQDILLYIISKIITLHNKGCVEIYSIIKEDSIAKIINS